MALPGFKTDGSRFILSAVSRGAAAVVTESPPPKGLKIPVIRVKDASAALSRIACNFYGDPSSKLLLVGITGTNGKTTTSYLVESILADQGMKTGVIGTVGYKFGGKTLPADHTTPESLRLQELFHEMAKSGVQAVVMEVSSHGLELGRVRDCSFDAAVFTNLTRDHMDLHKNFTNYYKAKKKLFELLAKGPKKTKAAVINGDDAYGRRYLREVRGLGLISYAIDRKADIRAEKLELGMGHVRFEIGGLKVESGLSGRFNAYNILAAWGVVEALRLKKVPALRSIARFKPVAGRFEVLGDKRTPRVIVDYSHTDDALKNASETARQILKGKLITVFGCGGDRDRTKRPKMGAVADKYSDVVIVTSDNPRSEDPRKIIEEILKGVKRKPGSKNLVVEPDRALAIKRAVAMARPEDVVLIAGKGHEDYQIFRDRTVHFSDREEAEKALASFRGRPAK